MKFIHLSDLHLHARHQMHRRVDPHAHLEAAVASIGANFSDAALCMVTGDLADKGEAEAYRDAAEILNRLPCPWHPLMGNHDDRAEARANLPPLAWHPDGFLQYDMDTQAGRFIALDTVLGSGSGILCPQRLNWLQSRLAAAQSDNRDVYLFMHHVPFDIGIDWLDGIKLENGEALAAVLKDYANIRHLFMGHIHRPCHGSWNGIAFSTVRTTAHQVALYLGDAKPAFIDENPSYAVILIEDDKVIIHDHNFLEERNQNHYDR